jgi:hypothetical protein
MDRDYSWEDQDYEEMQEWHEFQGELNTFEDYEPSDDGPSTEQHEGDEDEDEDS